MTLRYIGVFTNRQIIRKNSLKDFDGMPYIDHVFIEDLHHEFTTPSGYVCKYSIFSAINLDGTKKILKAGNFEIIDISHDEGKRNFEGRNITIAENNGQKIYTYRSTTPPHDFIEKDLMPLIDILTITGRWDIFCDLEKLKKSEKEIERLNEVIKKQAQEIDTLKQEIENQKPVSN